MTGTSITPASAAGLPLTYRNMCKAIAECERIDECKGWTDKAAALAAYAKMQRDEETEKKFTRIRLRATRRIGELLGQSACGLRISPSDPARLLSVETRRTARRVARVPMALFEELTESASPPGTTKMAALGASRVEEYNVKRKADNRRAATALRKWRIEERPKLRGEHILLDFLINRQPARNLTVGEVMEWAARYLVIARAFQLMLEKHHDERRVGDCVTEGDADAAMKLAKETI